MALPIDIPAVLEAATSLEEAAQTPLSVTLYIDDSATPEVISFVRSLFASASANARVSIGYLGDRPTIPGSREDMAIVVAGQSPIVGQQAHEIRVSGTPAMVVTDSPSHVHEIAEQEGYSIPVGDIVAPDTPAPSHTGEVPEVVLDDAAREPIPFDEQAQKTLKLRMGRWVVSACADKKLAFALAFPFVRNPLASESVNATSIQNMAVGAVAFIPGADLPIMTLNQAKMLLQIAAAYGEPMNINRVKELAVVVGGGFACRSLARQFAGIVPGLGWAVKGAIGFAGTEAMGRAAIEYFEAGGSIDGLASVVKKSVGKAAGGIMKASKAVGNDGVSGSAQKATDVLTTKLSQVMASGVASSVKDAAMQVVQGASAAAVDGISDKLGTDKSKTSDVISQGAQVLSQGASSLLNKVMGKRQ